MIPQPALNIFKVLVGIFFLSIGLGGCDPGRPELPASTGNNQQAPQGTKVAGLATALFSHPYLIKADEIRDEEGPKNAMPYYEAAVSLFEKEGNWEGAITARNRISKYYFRELEFDSLLMNLESTWELGNQHLDSSSLAFSEMQHWFGIYYERMNDPYKAISFQQKALDNRERQLGDNHLLVAESLEALGDTYLYVLSDHSNAEGYYERSVDIKSKFLDKTDPELVRGYYSVASVKRLNDDTESAINYGLKALKTAMLDSVENKQRIGLCHNILANTYYDKNDYGNAEYHYQKAIEISKANFGADNIDLPVYYNGLGSIHLEQTNLESAKAYFLLGLKINRLHLPEDSDEIADNFLSLGLVYTQLKKYDSASSYFNKSLKIKLKGFGVKNEWTAIVHEFWGDMYAESNQLDEALQSYQNSLVSLVSGFEENDVLVNPAFSSQVHGFRFIHVLTKKASLLKRYYHKSSNIEFLEASLKTYLLASRVIDLKRNNDITEESRLVLIENHFQDQMENGIDCAFLLHEMTGNADFQNIAFRMIEKSKYMLLFESLMKNESNQQFGIPDSLLALEKDLKVEMAFFKQSLDAEQQNDSSDRQRVDDLQNQVFATAIKQERLYEKLKDGFPNYYDIKFDSVTLSISDIQKFLKKRESEILAFYYGKKNIYTLGISQNKVQFKKLKKSQALEDAIAVYLDQISNSSDITDPKNYKLFCQSAFQLNELLIKPILPAGGPNKNLIIIPHGKLSVLPFESIIKSLPDYRNVDYKNLDYLIKDYQFSYAYSANLLFKNRINPPSRPRPKLLAFSYSNELSRQERRDELIGSSREINNISKLVRGTYLKGTDATESAFKSAASEFDILHLAVHGIANNNSNLSNSLLFKNESDSANDGILHSYELLNLDLNARLVVLSACETGLGRQFKGEGIFSMARSFAYAGSESIIMSYWKAKDNATAEVMGNFYRYLVDGATVDNALREAKIAYIEGAEELTAHPSTWAAFVPLGDMGTPIFQNHNASLGTLWYFVLASIAALIILFRVKRQRL